MCRGPLQDPRFFPIPRCSLLFPGLPSWFQCRRTAAREDEPSQQIGNHSLMTTRLTALLTKLRPPVDAELPQVSLTKSVADRRFARVRFMPDARLLDGKFRLTCQTSSGYCHEVFQSMAPSRGTVHLVEEDPGVLREVAVSAGYECAKRDPGTGSDSLVICTVADQRSLLAH